jgi:hypothetical protein
VVEGRREVFLQMNLIWWATLKSMAFGFCEHVTLFVVGIFGCVPKSAAASNRSIKIDQLSST